MCTHGHMFLNSKRAALCPASEDTTGFFCSSPAQDCFQLPVFGEAASAPDAIDQHERANNEAVYTLRSCHRL